MRPGISSAATRRATRWRSGTAAPTRAASSCSIGRSGRRSTPARRDCGSSAEPLGDHRGRFRAEPDGRLGEHLAVTEAERADPALTARDVADERAQLDELRLREVRVQLLPQRVVGEVGIPADRVRVPERDAFAFVEARRRLVPVELGELVLVRRLPSRPDGALVPSVAALERLRDPKPAELFQVQVDDPLLEEPLPAVDERAEHFRLARSDGLDLGARCAVQHRAAELVAELGILEVVRVGVGDPRHHT